MKLKIDELLKKGVDAHKNKKFAEAESFYSKILKAQPEHPDANYNMGALLAGFGKLKRAQNYFKTALEVKPDSPQLWLSYIYVLIKLDRRNDAKQYLGQAKLKGFRGGAFDKLEKQLSTTSISNEKDPSKAQLKNLLVFYGEGRFKKALFTARKLLEAFPNSPVLFSIIGAAYVGLKQYDAAIDNYNRAIKVKPDYYDAYFNIGIAQKNQGDLDAAISSYRSALKIKPDYAEAYNNLGSLLKQKGDLGAAISSYRSALKIKPDYAEAYNNLGLSLQDKGDFGAATDSYIQAININPEIDEIYNNIGKILTGLSLNKDIPGLPEIILRLLSKKNLVRPSDIALAATSILKFNQLVKISLESNLSGQLEKTFKKTITDLSKVSLLIKLMGICPLPDLEIEALLAELRCLILFNISKLPNNRETLTFVTALALQCFTNEYLYTQSDLETEALEKLQETVRDALQNGNQPNPLTVVCLACYKALNDYSWSHLVSFQSDLGELAERQIWNFKTEKQLRVGIPVFEEITDGISAKVRSQYEDNPYPRWVNLGLNFEPKPIAETAKNLNLKIFNSNIYNCEAPDVLIAGCGTGQQSIGAAMKFKGCNVLAVDLSLNSLAYAKRKTEELSLANIKYMQADILDLDKLGKQFDIIECAGVLHHLGDPLAGWKTLGNCLKIGGLMKIALYSNLARQNITKFREENIHADECVTNSEMKSLRNKIIKSNQEHNISIIRSSDFFSTSTLRDFFFHVQEHRFSIPQIEICLAGLGLKFCGFEFTSSWTKRNFEFANSGKDDLYALDKWHVFEKNNPFTFSGMYQFWCQKVG